MMTRYYFLGRAGRGGKRWDKHKKKKGTFFSAQFSCFHSLWDHSDNLVEPFLVEFALSLQSLKLENSFAICLIEDSLSTSWSAYTIAPSCLGTQSETETNRARAGVKACASRLLLLMVPPAALSCHSSKITTHSPSAPQVCVSNHQT
jgi:hypothetical protein